MLIDLAAALLTSRASLLHIIDMLQACGHEVCVWSALNRKTTREALQEIAVLEAFDDVYALDHMMSSKFNYHQFDNAEWLTLEQLKQPAELLRSLGVPESRMPRWLGWVEQ